MRGPERGKGRFPNCERRLRLRLDHRSDVGGAETADELGRAVQVQWHRLPIRQAERVVRSERIGRGTDYAIDEHAIEHALGEVELPGNRAGPGARRSGRDSGQHPPDNHRVPGKRRRDVVRIRWLCRRQPQQFAGYAVPNHVARQLLVDLIGLAKEPHCPISNEHFGVERSEKLDIGIGDQHHVVLRRCDRSQLDHLLLDPTTHGWERPAEVDGDVTERYGYERARQEVSFAADMRTWTGEPTEQLEVRPRHDYVMLDRTWRVVQHRLVQRRAKLEVRCEAFRDHSHARHSPPPNYSSLTVCSDASYRIAQLEP